MSDVIDTANEQAEYLLQVALSRHQRPKAGVVSAQFCADCDEPIPLLRQQKVEGCQTCVECQLVREVRRG